MYVYVYIYIYIYIYIFICVCVYVCMYVCMYVCALCVCMYECTYMCVCMCVYMYVCMHVCVCMYIYVPTFWRSQGPPIQNIQPKIKAAYSIKMQVGLPTRTCQVKLRHILKFSDMNVPSYGSNLNMGIRVSH
jgi:hypothetical protein